MREDVVQITQDLIEIPSVSRWSNRPLIDYLAEWFDGRGFRLEELTYVDENGEDKVNLVAQLGGGTGGLAFLAHVDTVPGQEDRWPAFRGEVREGRLYGRGSCDMKGPLAAAMAAAARFRPEELAQPLFIVATADEEIGSFGARQVAAESRLMQAAGVRHGAIIEPTRMRPVYAHKGACWVAVTAHGRSAHTSTDEGISSNFKIAPFLAEMAALAEALKQEEGYQNSEFDPPTNGFNMRLDDGGGAGNVTADRTLCTLTFRPMPGDRTADLLDHLARRAAHYGLDFEYRLLEPFHIDPQAPIVRAACAAVGVTSAETVPYGTDAYYFKEQMGLVVLGPGDIAQAHTIGEYIEVDQLQQGVTAYAHMIEQLCKGPMPSDS